MIYAFDVTTPANTAASQPMLTELQLTRGLIYKVDIEFPPGPLGYCHVQIYRGGHQVWPSTAGQSFHGDNGMIEFPDTYTIFSAPYSLTAVTWNEDDTWEHWTQIRIGLVSDEVFMARFLPSMTFDKMLEVLQELRTKEEAVAAEVIAQPFPWLPAAGEIAGETAEE